MKTLIAAIKDEYDETLQPLEDAFREFQKMSEEEIADYKGVRDDHALLAAFQVLQKNGFHFGTSQDREAQKQLNVILKQCKEEVKDHESVQARTAHPRRGKVRLHYRQRRALPA